MELYGYWQVLMDQKKEAACKLGKKEAAHSEDGVEVPGSASEFFSVKNTLALEASLSVPTFIRKGITIKI